MVCGVVGFTSLLVRFWAVGSPGVKDLKVTIPSMVHPFTLQI